MNNVVSGKKGFVNVPLEQRFWAKVQKLSDDQCWPWLGSNRRGYGQIWSDGSNRPAPQVSWEIANGAPFPTGKMACHTCDNPPCVNPAHIWPGTMSDNILDCVAKGRHVAMSPVNMRQSHCKRGHAFTPDNIYTTPGGSRSCRACRAARQDVYRARAALKGESHD